SFRTRTGAFPVRTLKQRLKPRLRERRLIAAHDFQSGPILRNVVGELPHRAFQSNAVSVVQRLLQIAPPLALVVEAGNGTGDESILIELLSFEALDRGTLDARDHGMIARPFDVCGRLTGDH